LQTDEDDRPVHPPAIKEVEVLWNPFDDIVPRSTREERDAAAAARRCGFLSQVVVQQLF
jgi:peptidyl-prolyl cis-trans isomerase SDCCAG10